MDVRQLQALYDQMVQEQLLSQRRDVFVDYPRMWPYVLATWGDHSGKTAYLARVAKTHPARVGDVLATYVIDPFDEGPFHGAQLRRDDLARDWDIDVLRALAEDLRRDLDGNTKALFALDALARESVSHETPSEPSG